MCSKQKIHKLFDELAEQVYFFVKKEQSGFAESWVPAIYIKEQLELNKSSYPQGGNTDNKTGWLFSTIMRHLQDKNRVNYKKIGNRAFYQVKN